VELDDAETSRQRRIEQTLSAVLGWLEPRLALPGRRPLAVGLSAPQGAGKTTLARRLLARLGERGVRAASVSIDDFYLRREEQLRLAAAHPGNRYLEHRGAPGTHDVELGRATLAALRALGPGAPAGAEVRVPVYDKSLHAGRGDRLAPSRWARVQGPLELVLVEGWMLGFQPVAAERDELAAQPALREVNERLRAYEAWHAQLDAMIFLRADELEDIVRWRIEAEEAAARAGKSALTREQIDDYIRRFLPLYALYSDAATRGRWAPDRQLELRLQADRSLR